MPVRTSIIPQIVSGVETVKPTGKDGRFGPSLEGGSTNPDCGVRSPYSCLGQYGKSASPLHIGKNQKLKNKELKEKNKKNSQISGSDRPIQPVNFDELLVERFALQSGARELLPWEAVAGCLRWRQRQRESIDVFYLPESKRARYGGLQTCGSVWQCPVCAAKITERRRVELTDALINAKELGLVAIMATYTLRHYAADRLAHLLEGIKLARKKATGGKAAKGLREEYGVVGSIRALEVTWSEENGWHVHVHELSFMPEGTDLDALGVGLTHQWNKGLRLAGMRDVNEHGCDVKTADLDIAAYIQKFGHERGWNTEHELTKQPTKRGREGHFTPSELLRSCVLEGNAAAGDKWREYAIVFKGSRQLYWSKGLRESLLPGVVDLTDQELAERADERGMLLAGLSLLDWKKILWNNKRAEVLLVAGASGGDRAVLDAFIADLEPAPDQTDRGKRITQMRTREVLQDRWAEEQEAAAEGLSYSQYRQWQRGGMEAIGIEAVNVPGERGGGSVPVDRACPERRHTTTRRKRGAPSPDLEAASLPFLC